MMIIDPFDEDRAADDDGTLMNSVRWIPIPDSGEPPTVADFDGAPIMGYIRPDGITYADDDETA